jgi:hypothetical protein
MSLASLLSRNLGPRRPRRPRWRRAAGWVLLLACVACQAEPEPELPRPAVAADTVAAGIHYVREYLFVGERADAPLTVSFAFSTAEQGSHLQRSARAWLAHGTERDAFLDEAWSTPGTGGVWRLVPVGDLRVLAGGVSEVEALHFRRGERTLRLVPEILRSSWTLREDLQYRLYEGRVDLAGLRTRGSVLETYRIHAGPTDPLTAEGALDWMFVTDGGPIQLLLAEAMGATNDSLKTFAWTVQPEAVESWNRAEIRWLERRPIEQARRDVPVSWSFRIPGTAIEGELFSLGYDLELGPDRPGRRAVQLRHQVEGWAVIGETRHRVFGLLRHSQG